jgi:hypothetical protein
MYRRKSDSYLNQAARTLAYVMAALCVVAVLLMVVIIAKAQTPAVNSTTATYPSTGVIATTLNGVTGTITPGLLLAGGCASGNATVTGVVVGQPVSVSPTVYPGDGSYFFGYVSAANTVTVKVCAVVSLSPIGTTYSVKVLQ